MNQQCPICLEIIDSELLCKTSCNHFFCSDCLEQLISNKKILCPMCRDVIKKYDNQNKINHIITVENTSNTENNIDIIELRNHFYTTRRRYYCINTFLLFYMMYVYYLNYYLRYSNNLLSEQYYNCSLELSDIKTDELDKITVCEHDYFKICSFPKYFVNKCLEYAAK